jgi:hypothetical protein
MFLPLMSGSPHADEEIVSEREADEQSFTSFGFSSQTLEEPFFSAHDFLVTQDNAYGVNPTTSAVSMLGSPSTSLSEVETDMIIGTIRLSGDIRCYHLGCTRTFGRLTELRRHYTTSHAVQRPEYWCSQPTCDRSMAGGRPFHRRDKMREHERRVHHRGVYRRRG